jgi:hypothetical protein
MKFVVPASSLSISLVLPNDFAAVHATDTAGNLTVSVTAQPSPPSLSTGTFAIGERVQANRT